MTLDEFTQLRYGMFIHFGLYSLLGRGEWVMNREQIPAAEYQQLADRFTGENFDADAIASLAVESGMRYLVFTTMHHDGFRLYDTELSDFCSTKTASQRDFTREIMDACQKHGLRVGLYHSLNQWSDSPSAPDALEDQGAYEVFIEKTFERLRELAERYQPADIFWYDGWWPFNSKGWKAEAMNEMIRSVQPHILFNGRNGLAGDYATPEQHLTMPNPWRPWEACVTLNGSWGFNRADHNWKPPREVITMLAKCASGQGNLLLNIGPQGDGTVPQPTLDILKETGDWLSRNRDAICDTEKFTFTLREQHDPDSLAQRPASDYRSDWNYLGPFTAKGNSLHQLVMRWPGSEITIGGLQVKAKGVSFLDGGAEIDFVQDGTRLMLKNLPEEAPDSRCTVIKIECDARPSVYNCAGSRIPQALHPNYDPVESDIQDATP